MLSKRKVIVLSILSFVVIGIAFIFWIPNQQISGEAQAHLDNLYSLSGKLTTEEKRVYFDNTFALEKLSGQQKRLPEIEMEKIRDHLRELIIENPDLVLSAQEYDQRYGHIVGHTHGHPHGEDLQQEIQNALEQVNAAIVELEASDVPDGVKESLRSILNLRRSGLLGSDSENEKLKHIWIEFLKSDPDVTGVTKDARTGEYIPTFANMLRVYRRRTHQVDGTVDDEFTGLTWSSNSQKNQAAIEAYKTALEMTPPWETPPAPPDIKGLRFSVEYEDVNVNAEEDIIPDKTEQPKGASNPIPHVPISEKETKAEEVWTGITDDVFSWQDSLNDIDDPQTQGEITIFLKEALGVSFAQFLEMSDAEIEEKLRNVFAPTETDDEKIKDLLMTHQHPMSDTTTFESNLQSKLSKNFSQLRTMRAIATINQLGPKKGLQRLKEVDPEVAKQLEIYLNKQEGEN